MQINDAGGSAKASAQGYILLQSTLPDPVPNLPPDLVPPRAHTLKQQLDGGGPVTGSMVNARKYLRKYRMIPSGREVHGMLKRARFEEDRDLAMRVRREYHRRWVAEKRKLMRAQAPVPSPPVC